MHNKPHHQDHNASPSQPQPARPSRILIRSANGQLRPAAGNPEIDDVWAQQRRIQLNEALAEKRRKTANDQLRHERGIVGLVIVRVCTLYQRVKRELFGSKRQQPKSPLVKQPKEATKSLEITIALPRVPGALARKPSRNLDRTLRVLPASYLRRIPFKVVLAGAALVLIGIGAFVYLPLNNSPVSTEGNPADYTGKPAVLERGTPNYKTLLPAGKSINELGGWTRISPPDREAVYAYVDKIGSIPINVSQQKLPADLRTNDSNEQIRQLARSFEATETINAEDITAYIGTSVKGPQSVIFNTDDLLILIKSTAPISTDQWVSYISSLK